MEIDNLINENVKILSSKTGKTIIYGCVDKIEIIKGFQYILFKNNPKKIKNNNIFIQFIIL